MKKIKICSFACMLLSGFVMIPVGLAAEGKAIDFVIDDNGSQFPQLALIQNRKLLVRKVGGDPNQDILFDAVANTLFIINHTDRSYYRIDQNVINKVSSMVESLSNVAESQQGVLSDLLQTLGLGDQEKDTPVVIKDSSKDINVANINCRIFQQYRDGQLETEMCISSRSNLSSLGSQYDTLDSFYKFGDQLLNRAGSILSNMGVVIPSIAKLEIDGLPVLVNSVQQNIRTQLTGVRDQQSPPDQFLLPAGYTLTPIPFIG